MARSLRQIALVVSSGTLLSKAGGMARQLVIAGAFGVGSAYDAYNYAYILPGFLLILLGGINGPFHNAMVTVLSRRPKEEGSHIVASLNTIVGTTLLLITVFLFISADLFISIVGPGLSPEIHKLAVIQLKIMAPITFLAGLIGLGFGTLNATNEFWIPAISPLMSSTTLIIGTGIFWIRFGPAITSTNLALKGGIILAICTLLGAVLQWLIQLPSLARKGFRHIKFVWDWQHPGVKEVLKIIGPATLSSGMLQINVCTDLFFASNILGAAAGLSYASLLVQAPLGIISNALIIPLLPTLAKLNSPEDKPLLIRRIRQGLTLSSASMLALGALLITLATPIVAIVFKRGAFDSDAVNLVSALIIAYGLGMPAYLGRDFLVRVFYSMGDARTPFHFSIAGIGLNILFDWCLVGSPTPWGNQLPFNFGAPGLVLATGLVNLITCTLLLLKLNKQLDGFALNNWVNDLIKLLFAGITSGLITLLLRVIITWPNGFWGDLIEVIASGSLGICIFSLISSSLGVKEIYEPLLILRRKLIHR